MIKSMTAFGRARCEGEKRNFTVELRSVNSRYFDCTVRLPRQYGALEEKIKSYLQNEVISRGKVEATLCVEETAGGGATVAVDEEFASGYIAALRHLRDAYGLRDDISVMGVARCPDVFRTVKQEEDPEEDWPLIKETLEAAAEGYTAMRRAEGERLEKDLRAKAENIRILTEKIAAASKTDIGTYRERLEARLRAILAEHHLSADEGRVLTECAIMADKLAVDEELVRLNSHLAAFDTILSGNEPAGRKLDFLMQEMNREANTVGSKCANSDIAQTVVAVKCELEKIREQIQNIE